MEDIDISQTGLDDFRPKLIEPNEFIPFGKDIIFLKNLNNKKFLKLTKEEAELVRSFNGKNIFTEILQAQLKKTGTTNFHRIFDLLVKLNSLRFLDRLSSKYINEYLAHLFSGEKILGFLEKTKSSWTTVLKELNYKFENRFLRYIALKLSSFYSIAILVLFSISNIFFVYHLHGLNFLYGFNISPTAPTTTKYAGYLLTSFILWLSFCVLISLKNFISAYIITSHKCEAIHPRVEFYCGLIYFTIESNDIVRAGKKGTIKLFCVRILFPLVIMFFLSLIWEFFCDLPLIILIKQVCIIIALMGISPLLQSDITMSLTILRKDTVSLQNTITFLKKRFLLEIFSLKKKSKNEYYYIYISIFTLIWLLVFFKYFWIIGRSSFTFLLSDLMIKGPIWGKAVIIFLISLLSIPLILIFLTNLLIWIFNLKSALRSPIKQLLDMAEVIKKKKVPSKTQIIKFLKQIPLFSSLDDEELGQLCEHLYLQHFSKNRNIIIQGEMGDAFYILITGRVAVINEEISGRERVSAILSTGDSFGEITLIKKIPRTATVRTLEPTLVFKLGKKYFDRYILSSAGGKEHVTDMIRISKMIQQIPIFSSFNPKQINLLILKLKKRCVDKDEIIIRQGEPGDYFYIIQEGGVLVEKKVQGKKKFKKGLGKGDFFGEIALIKNIPRTATVIAQKKTKLLYLSKEEFFKLLTLNLILGVQLDDIAQRRMQELGVEVSRLC